MADHYCDRDDLARSTPQPSTDVPSSSAATISAARPAPDPPAAGRPSRPDPAQRRDRPLSEEFSRHSNRERHDNLAPMQAQHCVLSLDDGKIEHQAVQVWPMLRTHVEPECVVRLSGIGRVVDVGRRIKDESPTSRARDGPHAVSATRKRLVVYVYVAVHRDRGRLVGAWVPYLIEWDDSAE